MFPKQAKAVVREEVGPTQVAGTAFPPVVVALQKNTCMNNRVCWPHPEAPALAENAVGVVSGVVQLILLAGNCHWRGVGGSEAGFEKSGFEQPGAHSGAPETG